MVTQEYGKHTQTFYLRSDDPKPSGVENGTRIIEVDTGKDYRFDAENSTCRNIQHGGDTPSPSGEAHFSKFSIIDWWDSETCYMDNTDGIYTLPNADTTFPRTDGYGYIFLLSPVKTITGLENLVGKYSVQFTPAVDFHVGVEFTGTVTAGDGKVYLFFYEDDEYQIMTDGVDFCASIS